MHDKLFSRVKRLVTGSIHDLVESIETAAPETVMREAIREIDGAIGDVRDTLGRTIASRHHASKRLLDTTSKHEELAEKAQFALAQKRDELAEAAIARQIDLEAKMPVLEATLSELSAEQTELEDYVSALLARKREMEADLLVYMETRNTTPSDGDSDPAPAAAKTAKADFIASKAEGAFDRALRGASRISEPARADSDTAAKLAELETITRTLRVEERLAALKARQA